MATRAEKRKQKTLEENQLSEILKYMNHFLKNLEKGLKSIEDPRHQSYTTYEIEEILMPVIFKNICNVESMSEMTKEFNTDETITNFQMIFGKEEIIEIPHYVTINDLLKRLEASELERLRGNLIREIIRRKTFNDGKLSKKDWKIIVDATYLYSFKERHCEHCLTQTFNRGKEDERTVYSHRVLEAKLVLSDDIIISLGTEFIENEGENVEKQDSETKAFKRLSKQIKKEFPRLPICILADSLYASEPVMKICEEYKWNYIIRFKDGSIPTLASEFEAIKSLEKENEYTLNTSWINAIEYKTQSVNVFTFNEIKLNLNKEKQYSEVKISNFKWISNIKVTVNNVNELVLAGRQRWKIENEGFNTQKNLRYNITHANSLDYNAMKNHYFLTQIADIVLQLYTASNKMAKVLEKSIKKISSDILKWLTTAILSKDDISYIKKRTTIHFL